MTGHIEEVRAHVRSTPNNDLLTELFMEIQSIDMKINTLSHEVSRLKDSVYGNLGNMVVNFRGNSI